MSAITGIAWTDHTFNPWWGCKHVSPGCAHCYTEAFDKRIGGDHWGDERRFFSDAHWNEPLKWDRKAAAEGRRRRVFCASMADVFEDRPDLEPWRLRLWALIAATPHLDWQLLTKRPENVLDMVPRTWLLLWPDNVWLGVTAENQTFADIRIPLLLRIPASVRFVSYEPALGPIDFKPFLWAESVADCRQETRKSLGLAALHWLIVGGESGPGARPFRIEWARLAVAQAIAAGVAVFVKQLGSNPIGDALPPERDPETGSTVLHVHEEHTIRDRKGANPDEWPEDLRVQQFPEAA